MAAITKSVKSCEMKIEIPHSAKSTGESVLPISSDSRFDLLQITGSDLLSYGQFILR